jgi:hypothetical protein
VVVTQSWANAVFRDIAEAVSRRDWTRFETLHHPEVVYRTPAMTCVGRKALVKQHKQIVTAIPDWSMRCQSVTIDPLLNRAVYEVVHSGTQASGAFELASALVAVFDEHGLVAKMHGYFDAAQLQSGCVAP